MASYAGPRITTQSDAKRQEALSGWFFMTPAMLVLILFLITPLLVAFYFSLTDWNGTRPLTEPDAFNMVGLENYERLLVSGRTVDDFYNSLKNTLYYVIGVVPTQTIIALVLAVIVNQKWLRGRSFFRTTYYFPSITSSIVVSLIFLFLFSRNGPVNGLLAAVVPGFENVNWLANGDGLIHLLLERFGITGRTVGEWAETEVLGLEIWDWISGPSVAMFTVMLLAVWTTIGTMMVIYLAALQNVPGQVYEAAQVDGATGWQTFRLITLPLLRPTTYFVITIGLIGTLQVFDQIYVLGTQSQSRESLITVAFLVYDTAFSSTGSPEMGRATATAVVLFIMIFAFTLLQRRVTGGDQAEA